jgi:hypothetical protein
MQCAILASLRVACAHFAVTIPQTLLATVDEIIEEVSEFSATAHGPKSAPMPFRAVVRYSGPDVLGRKPSLVDPLQKLVSFTFDASELQLGRVDKSTILVAHLKRT